MHRRELHQTCIDKSRARARAHRPPARIYYGFEVHLDCPTLKLPRVRDKPIMAAVMADKNLSWEEKQGINQCRMAFKMLWKSDGVTADGRGPEPDAMIAHNHPFWLSSVVFPREEPSARNWVVWRGILVEPALPGQHSGAAVGRVDPSHASSLALARGQRW